MLSSEIGLISLHRFYCISFWVMQTPLIANDINKLHSFFWFPLDCSSLRHLFPQKCPPPDNFSFLLILLSHLSLSSGGCHLISPFVWPMHTFISYSKIHFIIKVYYTVIAPGQFKVTRLSKETRDPRMMLP